MIAVTVKFDVEVPEEGRLLLAIEKMLRVQGDFRVFKQKMSDDSKLRVRMTPEERDKL